MKKAKKILVMVAALALTAAIAVGGTLAYLTSTTKTVKNTFTVGNVKIVLDEQDTDRTKTYGDKYVEGRDLGNAYKLYPGKSYVKDPTVTVAKLNDAYKHDSDSEDCWLFVKVVNGIAGIEAASVEGGYQTIAKQMEALGWTSIGVEGYDNVFAYKEWVSAGGSVKVFENFEIAGTVDNATLANYATAQITVEAYAIQKEGFATSAAAWTASPLTAWATSAG